ncbi:MAG: hypothetical protein KAJ01_10450 [Candidatus Hydrogenedentes bacterium]|nr:hypothetical protein [Candidatus Hydrogenedentota bacterium]
MVKDRYIRYAKPVFLTSFPKAGMHLLDQMFSPLVELITGTPRLAAIWAASHEYSGWGPNRLSTDLIMKRLDMIEDFGFGAGHMAAVPEVMRRMKDDGWAVLFLYRDLRDVAVSEAYHVMNPAKAWLHPRKNDLARLPNHKMRIRAIIKGYDGWPPLRERWKPYAGWLQQDWICALPFRHLREAPKHSLVGILRYLTLRAGRNYPAVLAESMILNAEINKGQTFRKGKAGGWEDEFDEDLRRLAERELGDWTKALGFDGGERDG